MRVPGGGNYLEFLMPGMFVMTMAFGIGETMAFIAADAERGVTDRFRSMPMASSAVVLGRSITDMIYVDRRPGRDDRVRASCSAGAGTAASAETAAAIGLLLLLRFAMLWVGIYLGLLVPGPSAVNSVWTLLFPLTMVTVAFAASRDDAGVARLHRRGEPAVGHDLRHPRPVRQPRRGRHSFVAQNAGLLAIAWPVLIIAIFAPLSVHRYRRLSR